MSKVLTIQRSKWRRGGNESALCREFGQTKMLNNEGFMCCLGFDALACGLSEGDILGKLWPSSLVRAEVVSEDSDYARTRTQPSKHGYCIADEADAVASAITDNDDPELGDAEREPLIREHLKTLGWDDVVFVD